MIPLAIKSGDIREYHLQKWLETVYHLATLPDRQDGEHTCHTLCRTIAIQCPEDFIHIRGKYNGADHSWLVFVDDPDVILDVYPWAHASGPSLLTTRGLLNPQRDLYVGQPADSSDDQGSLRPATPGESGPGPDGTCRDQN